MEKRPIESTFISRRPLTPTLEVTESNGNKFNKNILTDCVVVGRSKQADVFLEDDKLSRNHFMIVKTNGKFEIKDLNSSNGLVVNGRKVRNTILTGNDHIIAGETSFHFVITRDDLIPGLVLNGDTSFKGGDVFDKKYSGGSRINWKNKALLSSLSIGILIFAATLAILGGEKEAQVIPAVKKEIQLKSLVSIEKEIAMSALKEEERIKAKNYYTIAEEHFKAKNYSLAKKTMEIYFIMIPNSAIAPAFIAACDEAMGQAANVDDKIDDIEKDTAKRELITNLLKKGNAELSDGNYEEAISLFLKVINLDEYNEPAYNGLITAEKEIANKQKDVAETQEIKVAPESEMFAVQMQKAFNKKDYTKAFELALSITTMGQEKAGREPFLKAVTMQRNIKSITNRLYANKNNEAALLAKSDATDEAMKRYRQILAAFPYNDTAKAGLSKIMKNRHEQAKFLYAKALVEESYPNSTEAKAKLKMILTIVPSNDAYYQKALVALKKQS
ncbi:MAG: FHA domain-containing protein [Pseudomonadota bacterium]